MDEAIRAGLVAYASGDVESALRAWSEIDPALPEFEHVREYLDFVRQEDPDAFAQALGDYEIPGALAPKGQPLPPPVHAPVLPKVEPAAQSEPVVETALSPEPSAAPIPDREPVILSAPAPAPAPALSSAPPPAAPMPEPFIATVSGESSFTPPFAHAPPPAQKSESSATTSAGSTGQVMAEGLLPPLEDLGDLPLEEPDGMAVSGSSGWDPTASLVEAATASAPLEVPEPEPEPTVALAGDSDPIALPGMDADPGNPSEPIALAGSAPEEPASASEPIALAGSSPKAVAPPLLELDDAESGIHTEVELPEDGAIALPSGEDSLGGGAFDLVQQVDQASAETQEKGESLDALEQKLNELSELDDLSGALEVAKQILAMDPDHRVARAAEGRSRDVLMKMAGSKIGDLNAVPTVLCPPDQVIWLDLDHRSGFILSQVDGVSSYQDIMEIAGMDHLECALILAELVSGGVIGKAA